MVLDKDSRPSDELPSLPDLPGLSDLKKGSAEGLGGKAAVPNLTPEFRAKDPGAERDQSVVVDLPSAKLASDSDEPIEDDDPYLGRMFGNYELVQKVGQGGMGLVYKGRQVSLDRVVAVKILNKSLCDNAEFIKRFEREAKSIARINHPNIMAVYDFGQTDGLYYMVTEFIEGFSLSKQISDRVMLTPDSLGPLLVQCLAGLAHVGTTGIVHRDIKPDNILITLDGIAKIADFGLAKDVTRNDATDLTAVGLAMGTPAYMSPEQCMGRKLDSRSDIYALGVTAYLALTGEKPFVGQSSFEIMTKQREFTPPPPRQLNPAIPKEVSDLVMRMLAKNPQDRFKDSEDCRQSWLELGNRLGFMRSQGGMNDSVRMASDLTKPRGGASAPLPAMPVTMAQPVGGAGAAPAPGPVPLPGLMGVEPASNRTDPGRRSRISGEFSAPLPGDGGEPASRPVSERQGRSVTERRLAAQRAATGGEASTCAKCGMLNRGDVMTCTRCGNSLRQLTDDPESMRGQEAEAQRLMQIGQHKDAAALYARLADKEQDKRARAILRSKEREARTLENQSQLQEIQSRSQNMVTRGDIKGGIEVLERGLANVRDASASSTGAENRIREDINALRQRLRQRRQRRTIIVVIVVALLAAAALFVIAPNGLASLIKPAPAAPAAPAPATGPATGEGGS
ncbi:MAG: protein kinase [Planctomycetes bacterium]|nr:protein kinase [Planctomycetota bacterium]